jgi:uncharacterized repeat protein (TIGR04138 family)
MSSTVPPIIKLLKRDRRYKLDAYRFVREALDYAHRELRMGQPQPSKPSEQPQEAHVTGQQLCEAIRQYAVEQFGLMAKLVLNHWGIRSTGDFGEIVYNLIEINEMKKSQSDRREDFDDVYDFDTAFVRDFEITKSRRK